MSIEVHKSSDEKFVPGPVFWFQVASYAPGATVGFDGQRAFTVMGLHSFACPRKSDGTPQPWDRLELGGTLSVVVAKNASIPYPGNFASQAPALDANNNALVSLAPGVGGADANGALGVIMGGKPGGVAVAGTLTNTNDTVRLPISGGQWATAKFTTTNGASGTGVALEVSIDGGVNFFAGPMAKDVTSVSLNPPMFASGSGLTAFNGKTYEVPLPANCTHFQMRATGPLGLTANVTLSGGALYTPGMPVTAVLYDVTEGSIGAGFNSGTLDVSGWQSFSVQAVNPTTQVIAIKEVDDTGATPFNGYSGTAASVNTFTFSRLGGFPQATGNPGASQQAAYVVNLKRINVTQPAGGTVSTARARLVASR